MGQENIVKKLKSNLSNSIKHRRQSVYGSMLIPVFTGLPAVLACASTDLVTATIVSAPLVAVGAVSTSMSLKNVVSDTMAVMDLKKEIKKSAKSKKTTTEEKQKVEKTKKSSKSLAKLKDKIYKNDEKDKAEEVFDSKYLNPNVSKNLFNEEYNNSSTAM